MLKSITAEIFMELLIKAALFITSTTGILIACVAYYNFVAWLWNAHIDPKATFRMYKDNVIASPLKDMAVSRDDSGKIYGQHGESLGDVKGVNIDNDNDKIFIKYIVNMPRVLQKGETVEYGRLKIQFVHAELTRTSTLSGSQFISLENINFKILK